MQDLLDYTIDTLENKPKLNFKRQVVYLPFIFINLLLKRLIMVFAILFVKVVNKEKIVLKFIICLVKP